MDYQDRIKLMNNLLKESETVVTTASNSDITKSNNETASNPVEADTEEVYNVMTDEGFINQLNRLFTKGKITKEYYLKQVGILKNNYPLSYKRINEKLLIN